MSWQINPYTVTLFIAALVAAGLALSAWRRRPAPGVTFFILLMLAAAQWSVFYALELAVTDIETKTLWAKIEYIGIVSVAVTWFLFVLQYTRQEKWLTRRNLLLLSIVPIITLFQVWTNEYHHLVWATIRLDTSGTLAAFRPTYGPSFYVHIAYSYILLLLSTILLLRTLWRSPQLYRQQAIALVVAAFLPWLGNALTLTGLSPTPFLDLTPVFFTLSGLVVAWSLYRYQLLALVPVAHEAVIEGLASGVLALDMQNRIVYVNPAAERIIGRTATEAVGQPADVILTVRPDLVERYRDALNVRTEIFQGEGEARRNYALQISPLRDRQDRLSGRLVVLRDITEHKQAEEELRRQALTFENVLDSVILTDMQGFIIDCNPATEIMFGYTKAELLGETPSKLWHRPEEAVGLTQRIIGGIQRDGRWSGEINFIRKDGTQGVIEAVVVPLLDRAGEQIATIGVSHDITARKQIEQALLAQKDLFEKLVAVARATARRPTLEGTLKNVLGVATSLTDAELGSLFLLDEAGTVTQSIMAKDTYTPIQRQDILDQLMDTGLEGWVVRHRELVRIGDTDQDDRWINLPDQPYVARAVLAVPIVTGDFVLAVLTLVHSERNHFTTEHATLMQAAADQMALALYNARMFNDQRRLAEELYMAKRDADAANRAKSAFLASISHELRTPLHTVIGYSELIQDEAEELGYQEILSDLERIQESSRHLLTIINDILDFSKIEAGRMDLDLDTFSVSSLVEEIANSVQPLVAKNDNTLQVRLADDLGTMYSDLTKVRQTLLNLLSNAAKFTEQGEILLSVVRESVDGHHWIRVSVADTGIGMTEEQQQQIFEAFVQGTPVTTRKYGGTGLGLAISQRFSQMMGGAISVESTLGQGSTFTVRLPINVKEMSTARRSPTAEATAHLPAQPHATMTKDG